MGPEVSLLTGKRAMLFTSDSESGVWGLVNRDPRAGPCLEVGKDGDVWLVVMFSRTVGSDSTISLLLSMALFVLVDLGVLEENTLFVSPLPQGQQGQHFKYHLFQTATASVDRTPWKYRIKIP